MPKPTYEELVDLVVELRAHIVAQDARMATQDARIAELERQVAATSRNVLACLGYAPAIIQKRERPRYLQALRRADTGNYGPLAELIARTVLDNLYRFVVPALAGPARLVPLASLETPQISRVALRNAAQRGRFRAQRGDDGQWRSSRAWVEDYLADRYTRRPAKPRDERTS